MGITAIRRDYGVTPSMVRIETTDTLSTVSTAGYIAAQAPEIDQLNKGAFQWEVSDAALVYAVDGVELYEISSDFASLIPISSGVTGPYLEKALNLSDVDNTLVSFNNLGLGSGETILINDGDFAAGVYELPVPCPNFVIVTSSSAGLQVKLPIANIDESFLISQGPTIQALSTSGDSIEIIDQNDVPLFVQAPDSRVFYTLTDASTAAGTWNIVPQTVTVNDKSGLVLLDDTDLPVTYAPSNYSPTNVFLDGTLEGIDNALSGGGGSATLQTAYDTGNGGIQLDNSGLKPVFIESDSLGVPPQLKFEQLQIPAGFQATFAINAVSKNDLNNPITYNQMVATVASLTAGNEAALCRYNAYSGGTSKTYFQYDGIADEAQLNEPLNIVSENLGIPPNITFTQTQIPVALNATFAIDAFGKNDLNAVVLYNQMVATVASLTAGNEAALCRYNAQSNGTFKTYFQYDGVADEAAFNQTLNMNGNDIISVNDLGTVAAPLNQIYSFGGNYSFLDVTSQIVTPFIVGTGVGPITITGSSITLNEANIPGDEYIDMNAGQVNIYKTLDLKNNSQVAVAAINGNEGFLDFNFNPGELIVNGNNNLKLSSTGEIRLQNQVVYVPDGAVLTVVNPNTTYIFLGNHTFTSTLTINQPGVVIRGVGRDNTKIDGTFLGPLIDVVDQDFEISDITLSALGDNTFALTGSNFNPGVGAPNEGRLKTLNMYNCQLRNCRNGMAITGFDLVDISQTLFYYFQQRSDALAQVGVDLFATSKVEFTSCEFLRWFDETTIALPIDFFVGDQLKLQNAAGIGFGAVNINNCILHPQQNQNGVVIDNAATFGFGNIVGNTFIDVNLNTPTFLPLQIDINLQPSWIIEANQGVPNLLAFINSEVNANALVTTIAAVSTPTPILATTFIDNGSSRVTLNTSTGVITKDSKRSNYFTINLNLQFTLQSGGNNQNVEIGLLRNGTPSGPTTKVEADSGVPANASLNIIGFADQSDTFQLYIQNDTGANDILVNNIQLAGVEA
jgi:hypothetical protein